MDADTLTETIAPPSTETTTVEKKEEEEVSVHLPRYHIILLDDDAHTYEYVIEMLQKLFGHSMAKAFRMACEVDLRGRVIVDTATLERAELKRDQIHAYGPDWRISSCKGSMSALVEPAT